MPLQLLVDMQVLIAAYCLSPGGLQEDHQPRAVARDATGTNPARNVQSYLCPLPRHFLSKFLTTFIKKKSLIFSLFVMDKLKNCWTDFKISTLPIYLYTTHMLIGKNGTAKILAKSRSESY